MIRVQKLAKMAKKWRRLAATTRRKISLTKAVNKGSFVVYSSDQRRFVLLIMFLKDEIFIELLKLSEEEFGIPRDGPIILPCDTIFMDYVVLLLEKKAEKELNKALLKSISSGTCCRSCTMSSSIYQERGNQQLPFCRF